VIKEVLVVIGGELGDHSGNFPPPPPVFARRFLVLMDFDFLQAAFISSSTHPSRPPTGLWPPHPRNIGPKHPSMGIETSALRHCPTLGRSLFSAAASNAKSRQTHLSTTIASPSSSTADWSLISQIGSEYRLSLRRQAVHALGIRLRHSHHDDFG